METMSDQPRDPAAEPEEGRIVVITPDGMGVALPLIHISEPTRPY